MGVGRLFLLSFLENTFQFQDEKFLYHAYGTINGTLKGEFVHVVYSTRGGGVQLLIGLCLANLLTVPRN